MAVRYCGLITRDESKEANTGYTDRSRRSRVMLQRKTRQTKLTEA